MKRTVKMICLLGTAGVLLGAYFLAGNLTKKAEVSEEEGTFLLSDKQASDITELAWNANDTDFDFSKTDDAWTNNNSSDFPVNNDELNTLAEKIASLSGTRKLENVENLADYGLEEPAFSVTVTWSDGTKTNYAVGNETAFGDGQYLSTGEDGIAYIVSESPEEAFNVKLLDLAQQEEIPQVSDATQLTIGSLLHAQYRTDSTSIDPDQHWYDTITEDALTAATVEELISEAQAISWQNLVNVNATDDELLTYGADAGHIVNIGLTNENGDSMEIWIGGTNDDGDYYARLPDSRMVYTVTADSVASLIGIAETDVSVKEVMPVEAEKVKSAVLSDGAETYDFECSVSETASEQTETAETAAAATAEATEAADTAEASGETGSSEETTALQITMNGNDFTDNDFRTLWSLISALAYTERTEETPSGEPLLTIACENVNGVSETLSFYSYSTDEYICADHSGKASLVSADDIDRVRRSLSQYSAK